MLQVLAIEPFSTTAVANLLRAEGHSVVVERYDRFEAQIQARRPDLVVMDLSGDHSYEQWFLPILGNLATLKCDYLLIIPEGSLTMVARNDSIEDFVVKSGSDLPAREILARVQRIVRKLSPHKVAKQIAIDGLVIDAEGYEVRADGQLIELTYQEFLLLTFLSSKRGKVFTREQLLDQVWGYNYFGGTRTVDIHVRRIRAKLAPRYDRYIQTVRQVGYKFAMEVPS